MLAHSLISMLLPRPKRCQENAKNFAFVSPAMVEYYSYFTGVFCKCFNACAQLNQCAGAEAKKALREC